MLIIELMEYVTLCCTDISKGKTKMSRSSSLNKKIVIIWAGQTIFITYSYEKTNIHANRSKRFQHLPKVLSKCHDTAKKKHDGFISSQTYEQNTEDKTIIFPLS